MRHLIKKYFDKLWNTHGGCKYEKIWERVEKPFEHETPQLSDSKIADSYTYDNKTWNHVEYVYRIQQPVVLDPDYSTVICGFNVIFSPSAISKSSLPSFPRYAKSLVGTNKAYSKAILFDGVQGGNYFHFFSDVINKIWLLPKIEGYEKLPLIINAATYKRKYFQYILNNTKLKGYNWVIQQPGQYLSVAELYIMHPMPYDANHFNRLRQLLGLKEMPVPSGKVFLTRSTKSGRYISNMQAIQPVLDKYGFETVDTDALDMQAQIDLFAKTRYLIGLHGAGNTNILFSPKALRMLELNPDGRIASHYYWLATSLGINYYDAICGSSLKDNSYTVDAEKLEAAIQKLLAE